MTSKRAITGLLALGALTLAGCGGGGGGGGGTPPPTSSLSGTAAVGAAIQNGTLTALCADGSGFTSPVTTDINGSWSGAVASDALPCALQISGGTPAITLHSLATSTGVINVTPLTDLILALATGQDPASWYAGFTGANVDIGTATTNLLDQFDSNGFTIPAGNPFSTPFAADGTGWDALLDDIGDALEADASTYDALLALVRDGSLGSLPDAPPPPSYSISGTISGAPDGVNVVWELLLGEAIHRDFDNSNGAVTFTSVNGLPEGSIWSVVINTEPPGKDCTVSNGSGILTADVTNVQIVCVDEPVDPVLYTISGSISGASGAVSWQTLDDGFVHHDGSDTDGAVTFTTGAGIESGSTWSVQITGEPAGQHCNVSNGSGTLSADVTDVLITCEEESTGIVDYSQLQGRNGIALQPNGSGHVFLLEGANEYNSISSQRRRLRFGYWPGEWEVFDDTNLFNGAIVGTTTMFVRHLPGSYACGGEDNSVLSIDLFGSAPWNGAFTASECTIVIEHGSKFGGFQGYIASATLSNGTESFTIENAPFRLYQHVGTEGAAPALGANGYATLNIEGEGVFEFPGGQHFVLDNRINNVFGVSPDDGTPPFTGDASDVITLSNITPISSGTSGCSTGSLATGRYQGELRYRASETGASCTRTAVGSAGNFTWSTYSATLIAREADTDVTIPEAARTVTISGEIRNFMLNPVMAGNGGDEGEVGAEDIGIDMSVDDGNTHFVAGERFRFLDSGMLGDNTTAGSSYYPFDVPTTVDIQGIRTNKAATVGVYLKQLPIAVGTYICNDTDATPPRVQLDSGQGVLYGTTTANHLITMAPGASCSITIDSVTPEITGSYTATVIGPTGTATIMPDGDDAITISGSFRLPGAP